MGESEAILFLLPEVPHHSNPKRQGRLFSQVRLELLPPSPVSPTTESPLSPASSQLEPIQQFRKPPRLSLRISTDSFSTASTFWDQKTYIGNDELDQSCRTGNCDFENRKDAVRLRKLKSMLLDIKSIKDDDARKLTEMAFLS